MTEDLKLKRAIKAAIFAGAGSLALVSGSAMALETKVYGLIDVWAGSTDSADGSSTSELGSGGMSTSYLGFSAEQELEGGYKVVGALEMFFRPDTAEEGRYGDDNFFARSAFLGLQGDFGLVKAGRQTAPLFLPTILFNPFGDSFVFSPIVEQTFDGGYLNGDSGWSNAVSYTMPGINGLSGTVIYSFGEDEGGTGDENPFNQNGITDDMVGGNLFYRTGALAATIGAHQVDGGTGNPDQTAIMVGVSYDLEVVKLFGQYLLTKDEHAAGDNEYDTFQIGASVPVTAAGSLLLSYGFTDGSCEVADFTCSGGADFERDTYSVGYDHKLSDQFDVYAAYMKDDHDALGDDDVFGVGGRFKF